MAGGLIKLQAAGSFFFNKKKTITALDDGGDSDVWFPNHSGVPSE
jgi:hypothetical protein